MMSDDNRPVFRSDMSVDLVQHVGSDKVVADAARVSTDSVAVEGATEGLIRYLMRHRHGCYDSETEVYTRQGWKPFPSVTGNEEFLTRTLTGDVRWERAERVVHAPYSGEMIQVSHREVDLLVTPNHRMLGRRHVSGRGWLDPEMFDASNMRDRPYRLDLAGASRKSGASHPEAMWLGFTIADGCVPKSGVPAFNLRKERKIAWLMENGGRRSPGGTLTYKGSLDFRRLATLTYTPNRDRCIPDECLDNWSAEALSALLDGLIMGDGHVAASGKTTISTTSKRLVEQLVILGVLCNRPMKWKKLPPRKSGFGIKQLYRVTPLRPRHASPRVGWTRKARSREVQSVEYEGMIHCVTVPSGIILVRRHGKAIWCGNSPFESNSMTFLVECPIFVAREFMRHRTFSFNEMSGRYTTLPPVFYMPPPGRPLVRVTSPARPEFEAGDARQRLNVERRHRGIAAVGWAAYQDMLESGVASEVARNVLPVSVYTKFFATCNARSLMHFLSLRTGRKNAAFRSYPLFEIEEVAVRMEEFGAARFPETFSAFNEFGRVAP